MLCFCSSWISDEECPLGALRRGDREENNRDGLPFIPFSCGKRSPFLDKKEGSVPYLIWYMMMMIVYLSPLRSSSSSHYLSVLGSERPVHNAIIMSEREREERTPLSVCLLGREKKHVSTHSH